MEASMSLFGEPVFPVSYSTISEQTILERLLPAYTIPSPTSCTLLYQGRAYDLATFRWSARWQGKGDDIWETFLGGYHDIRTLSEADLRAVPLFVGIRNVWLMGLEAGQARSRGHRLIRDRYLDYHFAFLRKCEKGYPGI
jgi:hypothetical protein